MLQFTNGMTGVLGLQNVSHYRRAQREGTNDELEHVLHPLMVELCTIVQACWVASAPLLRIYLAQFQVQAFFGMNGQRGLNALNLANLGSRVGKENAQACTKLFKYHIKVFKTKIFLKSI